MERWVGRAALVTGASSGIGAAACKRLVELGMVVVGCARNVDKIKELSEMLKGQKGRLLAMRCDVTKEDEIVSVFERIKKDVGGVDVCINNAGIAFDAPLLSGRTDDWRQMIEVNVIGLSVCAREAYKSMKERNVDDGHIFLISSMSGHRVVNSPSSHMYCATKFAVKAITDGLRNELVAAKSHIRVTAISPGMVETEFSYNMFPDRPDLAKQRYSQFENLKADDIVDSMIYALSAPAHCEVHDILMRPTEQPF